MTCIIANTDNHSDDMIELWHGATEPIHVCGFHYMMHEGTQYLFNLARQIS